MKKNMRKTITLIANAVALAMGVALIIINIVGNLEWKTGATFAGIAIFCLALAALQSTEQ